MSESRHNLPRLVSPHDVCRALGISGTTLWRMRRAGEFPPPIRIGHNKLGWPEADVKAWIESRRVKAVDPAE